MFSGTVTFGDYMDNHAVEKQTLKALFIFFFKVRQEKYLHA